MIRTIIVDDDFLVRSYLKQLNAWEQAGYQIEADARDGEEALKLAEELVPDVLFTDISMPLMDGIELIRKIRERNRLVYIAVLSCHDDFEYVKTAMKLGADEYVLKNCLDEKSLYEILENIRNQLESRKEKFQKEDEERRLMEMGRHSLKYHFFNGVLSGSFLEEEREEKRKEAGISAKYINSAVINMFLPGWVQMRAESTELELEQYAQGFLQKLIHELKNREEDAGYAETVYLGEGVFCCFLDMSQLHKMSMMRQRLTGTAAACYRCCKKEPYAYGVGVSSICFGAEGIRQAYQQAREMIKINFYKETDILYYEESPQVGKVMPDPAQRFLEKAPEFVDKYQDKEWEQSFAEAAESFKRQHTDPRLVIHWLKMLDQKLKFERAQEQYAGIIKVQQLSGICGEYQRRLFFEKQRKVPEQAGPAVRMAADYLHMHFKEQIGLQDAAEAAGLNPAYLSYLFKQEINIGFSAYLLELRMECARTLLRSTNDKIKEIAIQSGFNDYHYFSKAFKKMNGLSPADYRKKKGNQKELPV